MFEPNVPELDLAGYVKIGRGIPVSVDGRQFPWYLADESIRVEANADGLSSIVYLPLLVQHVEVVGREVQAE
ncbi:MAG: hypothetical protein ACTH9H_11885 [Galactobacter sp.]